MLQCVSNGCLPTKAKVVINSHTWQIPNFNQESLRKDTLGTTYHSLRSEGFDVNIIAQNATSEKKMSCYLWLSRDPVSSDNEQLTPWLRLTLTTYQRDLPHPKNLPYTYVDTRNVCFAWISAGQRRCMSRLTGGFYGTHFIVTKPEFVLYDDLFVKDKDLLYKDMLTIVCEVGALTAEISYIDSLLFHPTEPVTVHMERTLNKDLGRMLETGQGSDITVVARDGQEFAAHTIILSSRTPVFAKMFEHDMQEKKEKRVTISDLDSDAVKGLLEFIYTDEVSNIAPIYTIRYDKTILMCAQKLTDAS